MAATTHTNVKKLLLPTTMSKAGWAVIEAREDVQGVEFAPTIPNAEFHQLLEDAAGIALGVRRFSDPELDAAPQLQVVSRIGVGYDEVDVPALNKRKVPLMIGGTSNSVSVAEAGVFLTMSLARKGATMDTMVKEGRWNDRYKDMPVDLYGKTVLIIGFGKIGTRSARRFAAMETNVLVYDPYMYSETIRGSGYEPVLDLDEAVARADFITIHCPKTPRRRSTMRAAEVGNPRATCGGRRLTVFCPGSLSAASPRGGLFMATNSIGTANTIQSGAACKRCLSFMTQPTASRLRMDAASCPASLPKRPTAITWERRIAK
jgi:D-3-phosphoglycerate dehydrogenase